MRPLATTVAVFVVFGLGALSGWVSKGRLDYFVQEKFRPTKSMNFSSQGPNQFQQIVDNLDLAPDQRTKVDQILADAQKEAQTIRQTINPQIRELKLLTYRQVSEELNMEQRRELRLALLAQRSQQKREREANSPPPPPGSE